MKKLFGLLSLLCLAITIFIGIYAIVQVNLWWCLIYLGLTGIAFFTIILFYCTKCASKTDCAHVIPGLMTRFFNARQPGPYTRSELTITFICVGLILLFPQVWLVKNWMAFGSFWLLALIGLILIVRKICVFCENLDCPFNKAKK